MSFEHPRIGDIYIVNFHGEGSSQRGVRPGVIFQNNVGNAHSPNVVVLPLTTAIKKTSMPTHVFIPSADSGVARDSIVLCENPVCINKQELGRYVVTLPRKYISRIAVGNLLASSAIAFVDKATLLDAWEYAHRLNGGTAA